LYIPHEYRTQSDQIFCEVYIPTVTVTREQTGLEISVYLARKVQMGEIDLPKWLATRALFLHVRAPFDSGFDDGVITSDMASSGCILILHRTATAVI